LTWPRPAPGPGGPRLRWRSVYLLKLPRLAKKTRVALSWLLEMIFSKDLEQMLTLRDVELISRIATSLRSDVSE
jgi:hypothetical protein